MSSNSEWIEGSCKEVTEDGNRDATLNWVFSKNGLSSQTSGISIWVEKKKKAKIFSQCFATSASGLSQNPEVATEIKMKILFIFLNDN